MKTLRELAAVPAKPSLLDKRFTYHNAATHGDVEAFRQRMAMYRLRPTWKPTTTSVGGKK